MEITKREIMFSIIIALIMILFGFFICNAITDGVAENNENYYKAVKITDSKQFQYGLQTAIGNTLVYGTLQAETPVSIPEINGEYFYIEKVKERYTRKTRTVTTTDSKGKTHTKTETYYEWDRLSSEEFASKQFKFMGVVFENPLNGMPTYKVELEKFAIESDKVHWNYLYEDKHFSDNVGDIRYYFYITPKSFNATVEAKIKQDCIVSFNDNDNINVHYEKTIPQVMDSIENKEQTVSIIFWILWSLLIVGAVVGFYYIDNRWLEG